MKTATRAQGQEPLVRQDKLTVAGSHSDDHGPDGGVRSGWSSFVRHYVEMVLAMFVGMAVVGGAVRGVLALAAVGYSETRYPELTSLEMAFSMSVGMVVWMRHRGHGWAGTLEMVGAMFAPAVGLFPLLWLDVISAGDLLVAMHVLMLPLMLVVMLRRRHEHLGCAS